MPCYQLNLISVEFKGQNIDLLRKSAEVLGYSMTADQYIIYIGGMFIDLKQSKIQGDKERINQLKREYSRQAVKHAAKNNGWILNGWKDKERALQTTAIKY